MAFPKDLKKVSNNLAISEFKNVIWAIENNKVQWLGNSMFAGSCSAKFKYRNNKYELIERCEEVQSIHKINKGHN